MSLPVSRFVFAGMGLLASLTRFTLVAAMAAFGSLFFLFLALWLKQDPILSLQSGSDWKMAAEELLRIFSPDARPSLLSVTATSLSRVAGVVILSTVAGTIGAFVLCRGTRRWRASQPILDFLRSTPITLWIGVAGAFFVGGKNFMSVMLATIPCSLIMLYQVRQALTQESDQHRHVFRLISKNTNPWTLLFLFTLPKALPSILTGLRLIVSYALVLIVVLEMCGASGSDQGLGDLATKHNSIGWSCISIAWFVGCIGFLLNKSIEAFEDFLAKKVGSNHD